MATVYKTKVIISGNVVEVFKYEEARVRGYSPRDRTVIPRERKFIDFETGEVLTEEEYKLKNRQRHAHEVRRNVRRLALANFDHRSKFVTMTFRENLQDIEEANRCFKAFIRNVNAILKKDGRDRLKYLAVIEFQKRGAIHYHMLCDLPSSMRYKTLIDCWRRATKDYGGSVRVEKIDHVDNVGAYIVKYMTKDNVDMRLAGKKSYQTSRNLKRPRELVGDQAERFLVEIDFENKKIAYQAEYEDKHTGGSVTYLEINLNRQNSSDKDTFKRKTS